MSGRDEGPRRFVIVGDTGSGKSTLAAAIARRLKLRHIELDALHWGPDWTPNPADEFRDAVSEALAIDDGWVVDGNYSAIRNVVWPESQVLVWLDYPFLTSFRQLFGRTTRRVFRGTELWSGNHERFLTQLFTRDSIFCWLISTHRRYRREYVELVGSGAVEHLQVVRLGSPTETRRWLEDMAAAGD